MFAANEHIDSPTSTPELPPAPNTTVLERSEAQPHAESGQGKLSAEEKTRLEAEVKAVAEQEEQELRLMIQQFLRLVPWLQQAEASDQRSKDPKSPSFLAELADQMQQRTVASGTQIVKEGDIGAEMFFVVDGFALVSGQANGNQPFAELGPLKIFGEGALLTAERRNATVTARTDMELYALSKGSLDETLQRFPTVGNFLSAEVENRRAQRQVAIAARQPPPTPSQPVPQPAQQPPAPPQPAPQAVPPMKTETETERALLNAIREFLMTVKFLRDAEAAAGGGFLVELAKKMEERRIRQGMPILNEGDIGAEMFFVVDGFALVSSRANGNRAFAELGPTQFFGEGALLTAERRNATVTARTDMDLYALSKGSLDETLQRFPTMGNFLSAEVENRRAQRQAANAAKNIQGPTQPSMPAPTDSTPAAADAGPMQLPGM
jgi:CRP-like cAMP-binding protein